MTCQKLFYEEQSVLDPLYDADLSVELGNLLKIVTFIFRDWYIYTICFFVKFSAWNIKEGNYL